MGDHLRRKRMLLGLRQRDVATILAISIATLERWERNETQPKPYLIPRIIDFLGYAPYEPQDRFGSWLLMARRALGLSRKRLAKRLSVDESTIFRWESGRAGPQAALLRRLRAVLTSDEHR
ncbi:MAG: helix-turn-helix domain-containing protein [Deltaproteobacteria bacterium]|nr:helix-turn-helix domain-containing protein [Deltaproteobacteria bacterium]MBI3390351.1 helix-turn-helix domain-containing protein [Deltaproteobacteria bacterium]